VSNELERARVALGHLPTDDRELWVKMAMALKTEFGEESFSLWSDWSCAAKGFSEKDARDVWKSVKAGKVKLATLFFEAKKYGFDPRAHKATPIDPAERARRDAERAVRDEAERQDTEAKHAAAAAIAEQIWTAAAPAPVDHPYLVRKAIGAGELRVYRGELRIGTASCDGALIVPAWDTAGTLWTVEFILEDGQKRYLPNGRKAGSFAWVGGAVTTVLLIGEGYATCATLAAATGFPAAVAFDAGGLLATATAMRAKYPDARIVLCADDDHKTSGNPGLTKARAAADAVGGAVAIPDFGDKRPFSGTDFNDLAAHLNTGAVATAVHAALATSAQATGNGKALPAPTKTAKRRKTARAQDGKSRFVVDEKGVWFHGFNNQGEALPPHWVSTRIDVIAETRNEVNSEWGYLLEFTDRDGVQKRWAVPAGLFAGDGTELRRMLLDMGVKLGVTQVARTQIANYIQMAQPDERVRCVPRVGWHGGAFVLPDRVIGTGSESLIYQADIPIQSQFKECGTLDEWRREVAAYCVGNTRLLFCVASAFAGPLLHFSGLQSGGFHMLGTTSEGKSTGGAIAASVFGSKDYVRSWKSTDNALEAIATQHSDALLILDEIGQVEARLVGSCAYMLANESGKHRATRTGAAKPALTWRLLFLSNGEKSVAALMAEANQPMKGGIEVRLPVIPSDAGKGMGVIEELHGFDSPRALVEHLKRAANSYYGAAGPTFIEWASKVADELPESLRERIAQLVHAWVPDGAHSQVARVAERFALVGAAGELATAAGLTGWPQGESTDAARTCFEGWLQTRGGTGNSDQAAMLRQIVHFVESHGAARFEPLHRMKDDHRANVMHRAGFKKLVKVNANGEPHGVASDRDYVAEYGAGREMSDVDADVSETEYWILAKVFRDEVCKGFDYKAAEKLLIERKVLMPRADGHAARSERVPTIGKAMVYRILPSIFLLDL
jgi:putative DNA primase/helicase